MAKAEVTALKKGRFSVHGEVNELIEEDHSAGRDHGGQRSHTVNTNHAANAHLLHCGDIRAVIHLMRRDRMIRAVPGEKDHVFMIPLTQIDLRLTIPGFHNLFVCLHTGNFINTGPTDNSDFHCSS